MVVLFFAEKQLNLWELLFFFADCLLVFMMKTFDKKSRFISIGKNV
jgi:hypothetical protein